MYVFNADLTRRLELCDGMTVMVMFWLGLAAFFSDVDGTNKGKGYLLNSFLNTFSIHIHPFIQSKWHLEYRIPFRPSGLTIKRTVVQPGTFTDFTITSTPQYILLQLKKHLALLFLL